jgi:hypothetical protein
MRLYSQFHDFTCGIDLHSRSMYLCVRAQKLHGRLVGRYGKAKALSVRAHKLGRAVFFMQKRRQPFDAERFYAEA